MRPTNAIPPQPRNAVSFSSNVLITIEWIIAIRVIYFLETATTVRASVWYCIQAIQVERIKSVSFERKSLKENFPQELAKRSATQIAVQLERLKTSFNWKLIGHRINAHKAGSFARNQSFLIESNGISIGTSQFQNQRISLETIRSTRQTTLANPIQSKIVWNDCIRRYAFYNVCPHCGHSKHHSKS